MATSGFLDHSPLALRIERSGLPVLEVSEDVLASLADADGPQGVVSVADLPRGKLPRGEAIRAGGVYLFLDQLQDPGNLGAIARVAEASGAAGLALSPGCVHPNHPRALRGSAGSLLRFPVSVETTAEELDAHLRAASPKWLALTPRDGVDLYRAPPSAFEGSLVLALGAEGSGLSAEVTGRATFGVTIPIQEPVESLNVAVSAAVVLFEIARRRRLQP